MALGDRARRVALDRAAANRLPTIGAGDPTAAGGVQWVIPTYPDPGDRGDDVTPISKEERTGDVSRSTREAVLNRANGRCEARVSPRCVGVPEHIHHRKLRRFGDHTAVNLLAVCHACHIIIHSRPIRAYHSGMMVRGTADPAMQPVRPGPW